MRVFIGGCVLYAVAENGGTPRQLFNVAPGLRGRTAWQPQMSSPAALPAIDPALYVTQQDATVGGWAVPQFAIASQYEAEQPQSSFFDTATVLFCAMAGAAAGYAATVLSRGQHASQPAVATLGIGGQATQDAKRAWLAKLDAPTWGTAATALASVVSEAAHIADMTEACYEGDDVACDNLSREDEAKRAWMASLDVPTWGAAAAAVSAVATQVTDVTRAPVTSENAARKAWLASVDASRPSWGKGAKMSEDAAKTAWLAKLDAPSWGQAAAQVAAAAQNAPWLGSAAAAVSAVASEVNGRSTLSAEEIAKQAWLAKLDTPTWGHTTAAWAAPGAATSQDMFVEYEGAVRPTTISEDAAKQAWLANVDTPSWGNKAAVPAAPVSAPVATPSQDLFKGYEVFRPNMSQEAAKMAWLAKQDMHRQRRTVSAFDVAALAVGGVAAESVAMLGVGGQADPSLMAGAPPQSQTYSGGVASTRAPPMLDSTILVQGGSLRTWSYKSPAVEQVQVVLSTEGRPLDADIELWHGPDNTPVKMRVYVENGQIRPFSAVIETPRGPNTVAIRNIGQIEFPIAADVIADVVDVPSVDCASASMTIQGGALRTYPFDPTVDSVEVQIKTDGRPLNARIELLQGPNNNKEVIELYTEDGCDRPFFCILETPGSGNVVRIVNTSPVEFPMSAAVVPHSINQEMASNVVLGGDVIIGGDVGW
jgi:hypothetical protein